MKFLKNQWSNILFLVIIVLLFIPATRKPIQVQLNRIISFSPSTIPETKRNQLLDYNWRLKDMEGNISNLKKARGEVVIINFWATWCPPCIAEMPSFQKIVDTYGDRVQFFFVSSEEQEKLNSFMRKKDYNLPVYQPLSQPSRMLDAASLPTTYVLSREGEIVVSKTGAADWNSKAFRKLLDELLQEQL
ncbi:TlpA family protein disulfide reductase [Salinimicrobium sp. GXAS 041]|uniref:TlpA family protein disulfide reductase n=1 Tax=Salinimicrobium sp. GXAS 041 TaxID=3400806 RepID=UPI003C75DC1E